MIPVWAIWEAIRITLSCDKSVNEEGAKHMAGWLR